MPNRAAFPTVGTLVTSNEDEVSYSCSPCPYCCSPSPRHPPSKTPPKARLEGQVINSVSSEPLRKTRLTLRMNAAAPSAQRQQQPAVTPTYTVTTDAAGKFEFPNVEPGDYQLSIRRDGFANLVLGAKNTRARPSRSCSMPAIARPISWSNWCLSAILSGTVLDEDGDPIRGITVAAMTYRYTTLGRELQEARTASTNDLGEYRIFDVPRESITSRWASATSASSHIRRCARPYGLAFYPGHPQVSGAIAQEVTPGAQLRNLNFNLRKTRYPTIRGKVIAPANATNVNAGMMIVDRQRQQQQFRRRQGQGQFLRVLRRQPRPALS